MTEDWRTRGQYLAAAQSIKDTIDETRGYGPELAIQATLTVALSNLAVAEAVHRVADTLGHRPATWGGVPV